MFRRPMPGAAKGKDTGQQTLQVGLLFFWIWQGKIGNGWRWARFNLVNHYSNLLKLAIWQVKSRELLEML